MRNWRTNRTNGLLGWLFLASFIGIALGGILRNPMTGMFGIFGLMLVIILS